MVLKFEKDSTEEVYFVESTCHLGVHIVKYSDIKDQIGKFYQKIVLRHLDWDRSDESLTTLIELVNKVNGNSYDFSVIKQVAKRTSLDDDLPQGDEGDDDDDENLEEGVRRVKQMEDGRAFFCSELVAKAYKLCGVL